jgi:DNA-binding MarR family transcriptional regulator
MEIAHTLKLKKEEYYITHLRIVNALLPAKLTEKELEVLSCFMSLDEKLIDENYFNVLARKKVRLRLNLSQAGLSNHLKGMITKKFLLKNEKTGLITIQPFLLPDSNSQLYKLKLIRNVSKE